MSRTDHCDHHHNSHHHHDDGPSAMPLEQKALKLLDHWINHNDDHGENYIRWAGQLRDSGHLKAAEALDQVSELTRQISDLFRRARKELAGFSGD